MDGKGMLHIVTTVESLQKLRNYCENFIKGETSFTHSVVLIEEAVHLVNVLPHNLPQKEQEQCKTARLKEAAIFFLTEDLLARGFVIPQSDNRDGFWRYTAIDYEGLVDLTASHALIRTVSLS